MQTGIIHGPRRLRRVMYLLVVGKPVGRMISGAGRGARFTMVIATSRRLVGGVCRLIRGRGRNRMQRSKSLVPRPVIEAMAHGDEPGSGEGARQMKQMVGAMTHA